MPILDKCPVADSPPSNFFLIERIRVIDHNLQNYSRELFSMLNNFNYFDLLMPIENSLKSQKKINFEIKVLNMFSEIA